MELQFEYTTQIGVGTNPNVVNLPDNTIMLFYVDAGNLTIQREARPEGTDVDWGNVTFSEPKRATRDKAMSLVRLKNVPRLGVYGVWHSNEPTPRHRFAIYEAESDISKYLVEGTIELRLETPITDLSLTLENPKQVISGEDTSLLVPGSKIELNFTAGDSELYPMGVFYGDRVEMSATGGTASIEGRNISGKKLKDQTFDYANLYPIKQYDLTVVDVLVAAGVTNYQVQAGAVFDVGMEFSPSMTFLDGIYELLKASRNWQIRETLDGEILIGSIVSFEPIQLNSKYTFERGKDCWSRNVVRDDFDVYSRVCVCDGTLYIYQNVEGQEGWAVAPQKTLYVEIAEGTPQVDAEALALEIAERIAKSGTLETFIGSFRPHLLPGDEAEIVNDSGSRLLGLVTTVRHSFSKSEGFVTEFVVDSGGAIGKPQIKELIDSIAQRGNIGSAKRL